jgi:hypothetical protein
MKITKEEYLSLYDENITKKAYDAILDKINKRFYEIVKHISIKFVWFDYDNEGGKDGPSGYFEPDRYKENDYINFVGEYSLIKPYDYCDGIPIRWLWEDYEEEFNSEVLKFKDSELKKREQEKQKREEQKNKKLQMREIIKSKLTKEELRFIEFK